MIASRRTSAHVHSVFEIDFSRVAKLRDAKKAEYERAGAKLTYLPFIVKAVVDGLRAVPVVNSSIDGDERRLPQGHQHRDRGGPRLGPHRARSSSRPTS